jgi:hypothetical protein
MSTNVRHTSSPTSKVGGKVKMFCFRIPLPKRLLSNNSIQYHSILAKFVTGGSRGFLSIVTITKVVCYQRRDTEIVEQASNGQVVVRLILRRRRG